MEAPGLAHKARHQGKAEPVRWGRVGGVCVCAVCACVAADIDVLFSI